MRPSWEQIFVQITELIAKRSTCIRLQVGAVLVRDNRIISMGYNGVTSGHEHCNEIFKNETVNSEEFKKKHAEFSKNEIHAESNAIAFSAKEGQSTNDCDLYVTHAPCIDCAKLIVQSGIKNVYYINEYDRNSFGIDFLEDSNINCIKI